MLLSVVIPAFNEVSYLPATLDNLRRAAAQCSQPVETIVVDNASTDGTAAVAREAGAVVICEKVRNIGRVRNTGAAQARGEVLVFVDADTTVPAEFLRRVAEAMADPRCIGGAANIIHSPVSRILRVYLAGWRAIGKALGMAQGAAQFCRREAFLALGGYDESMYMGEDVDFYWRLRRLASRSGDHLCFLSDVAVLPSPRRFDQWPLWRTLIGTNPVFIAIFRKSSGVWKDWYGRGPR